MKYRYFHTNLGKSSSIAPFLMKLSCTIRFLSTVDEILAGDIQRDSYQSSIRKIE